MFKINGLVQCKSIHFEFSLCHVKTCPLQLRCRAKGQMLSLPSKRTNHIGNATGSVFPYNNTLLCLMLIEMSYLKLPETYIIMVNVFLYRLHHLCNITEELIFSLETNNCVRNFTESNREFVNNVYRKSSLS